MVWSKQVSILSREGKLNWRNCRLVFVTSITLTFFFVGYVLAAQFLPHAGLTRLGQGSPMEPAVQSVLWRQPQIAAFHNTLSSIDDLLKDDSIGLSETKRRLKEVLRTVESEPSGTLRRAMATLLFRASASYPPELKFAIADMKAQYVPVFANDRGMLNPAKVVAVPAGSYLADNRISAPALQGPRVTVAIPEQIIVEAPSPISMGTRWMANPFDEISADESGKLALERDSVFLGMNTAFVTANRVISNVERWVGRRVNWGNGGQLTVVTNEAIADHIQCRYDITEKQVVFRTLGCIEKPDGQACAIGGFTGMPKGWERPVSDFVLDPSRSTDAVAHEAGHAAVAALKPGFYSGVAIALHEALADATVFLTALDDWLLVERVLEETGGDLRRPNEASRICEGLGNILWRHVDTDLSNDNSRFLRFLGESVTLDDFNLRSIDDKLPEPIFAVAAGLGAHNIGQIISGALYTLFVELYESALEQDCSLVDAVENARNIVGSLMLKATAFIGEHAFSFRDYALALLRIDRDCFDSEYRPLIRKILVAKKLISPDINVELALLESDQRLIKFSLPPDTREPGQILEALAVLENYYPENEDTVSPSAYQEAFRQTVFLQRAIRRVLVAAEQNDRWLYSDVTVDGLRLLKLRYIVPDSEDPSLNPQAPPLDPAGQVFQLAVGPGLRMVRYASLVFDAAGELISLHVDEPIF